MPISRTFADMAAHGIIFDCDGTLVNSLDQALESFNFALDQLGEKPRSPDEIKKYFGAAADRILISLIGDREKGLKAFEAYKDHQTLLAPRISLHEGVRELLETLAAHKVPMSVVTGRHEEDLEILLKPHKIHHYFVTLIADSQLPHSKPAPDGILLAASRMGIDPAHAIYVGDSQSDVQAAHAAGAQAVAALWDPLAKPELMALERPRYSVRRPIDVWESFKDFSGQPS